MPAPPEWRSPIRSSAKRARPSRSSIAADSPGGHWNDAYPFVRLHGPAASYGVNSRELASDAIETVGTNAGLHELSSGPEIVGYYGRVMRHLLASGRVRFFSLCDYHDADRCIRSRIGGGVWRVDARTRIVDAAYADVRIPATHPPPFGVGSGVNLIHPGLLPAMNRPSSHHVVIGCGKTGIDACLWLLEHGVAPDAIRWIVPHDPWLLDRANMQFTARFFERSMTSLTSQLAAVDEAASLDDLFARLEAMGELLRLDPGVTPTAYRCATVTGRELEMLRGIRDIVRLGRVRSLEASRILLDAGELMSGISGPDFLARVAQHQNGTAPLAPMEAEHAALAFCRSPSYLAAVDVLVGLNKQSGVRVHRPMVLACCIRTLRSCKEGIPGALADAAIRAREENRLLGRPLPKRAVGSTLLLKGLEAEVAVIVDIAGMDKAHLYVAMTRGHL